MQKLNKNLKTHNEILQSKSAKILNVQIKNDFRFADQIQNHLVRTFVVPNLKHKIDQPRH